MFTVNGKELDYDIFDADKADLIQRVMEETFQKIASIDANSPENTWAGFVREIVKLWPLRLTGFGVREPRSKFLTAW